MTSMLDILTTLLLFLLKSFVAEGDTVVPPPGLELPQSTALHAPQTSLVVAIDDDAILLGSERIASLQETASGQPMLIASLDARLKAVRSQREQIASLRGQEAEVDRLVTIQGDRQIEFQVLQKVMYTLNRNGYDEIALAVIQDT